MRIERLKNIQIEKVELKVGSVFTYDDEVRLVITNDKDNGYTVVDLNDDDMLGTFDSLDDLNEYYEDFKITDITEIAKLVQ